MENANPIAGDSDVTSADPVDLIQAWMDKQEGNEPSTEASEDSKPGTKPDKAEEGDPEKTSEPQFTTSHLAQFLGIDEDMVDVDEDGQPVFKTKINGEEGKAKFKDFLADYQKQKAADKRLHEASEKEKAADRRMQEAEQAVTAKLNEQQEAIKQVATLALVMNQDLQAERQSINWDALWQENPAHARALERRFDERQQKINATMGQLRQRDAQIKQQAAEKSKELEGKALQAQEKRLVELIPDWSDQERGAKEMREIRSWAEKSGLELQDLKLQSATTWFALRRAWQHDTLSQSKPEVENKLRAAPKLVKPGAPTNTNVQDVTVKGLKAEIKKSKGTNTKALEALLIAKGLA